MQLLIIFGACLVLSECRVIRPCGDSININNTVYKTEVLNDHVHKPYQLAIDHDTNTLFFSYFANKEMTFETVFINLKDKTSGTVSGVNGGFANAVDKDKHIVYIGGTDGIYKFNYNTKKAEKLDITDENIWQLFYKDGLYFTTSPEKNVYLYKNAVVRRVPELENTTSKWVAVDNDNNLIYSHKGELHKIESGKDTNLGDYDLNAFNTDVHGNVYFSTYKGIYRIVDNEVKKITFIDNIRGFVIDSDGSIIYANDNKIIKLIPTYDICYNPGDKIILECTLNWHL